MKANGNYWDARNAKISCSGGIAGLTNDCPSGLVGKSSALMLTLLNTLLAAQCAFPSLEAFSRNVASNLRDGDHYDMIVLGAESAGAVVANRLSENLQWKIPNLYFGVHGTDKNWLYVLENVNTSCGKLLGGTSATNTIDARAQRSFFLSDKSARNRPNLHIATAILLDRYGSVWQPKL